MAVPSETTLTTAEMLAAMPHDGRRRELYKGNLRMMSPAGGRHGEVAFMLGYLLGSHVIPRRLGAIFAAETGFLLARDPDTVRAPDVAFVSQARIKALPGTAGFLPLAPDLVGEVVSPHETYSAVEEKALSWIQSGTKVVLVVDPTNRTVTVFRPDGQAQVLDPSSELVVEEVLPGWRLRVSDLFGEG